MTWSPLTSIKAAWFPEVLPKYLQDQGVDFDIIEDTFSIVKKLTPEGKTTCPVCSRLRWGTIRTKNRATKIALGHHLDDVVETLFLNMFYGGRMKSMPAKLAMTKKTF